MKYSRAFAEAWPDPAFVQQPAAQIPWTPIGVADFVTRLVETLPEPLEAAVPSVKEIEAGLSPVQGHPEEQ